jgi:hypothetical protein
MQVTATCRRSAVLQPVIACLLNDSPALLMQVYGLPTLIVFKDGQEVEGSKTEGAVTKVKLADYIKKYATAKVSA